MVSNTKKRLKIKPINIFTILLYFSIVFYIVFSKFKESNYTNYAVATAFGILGGLLIVKLLLEDLFNTQDIELDSIFTERAEINNRINKQAEPDIFDTIRLSLNQLNEYYTINKAQAKSSFLFSVVAIILGLGTLLIGIGLFYYGDHPSISTTSLTSLSGILLEFIGGAYFFMYKKSLEQVNFFFGQLIKVQDTMLAINLSKGMEEKLKAGEMTERIIMSLLERSLK